MGDLWVGPKLKPSDANATFIVFLIVSVGAVVVGTWGSTAALLFPFDPMGAILGRYGWAGASFFVGTTIAFYLRRDPKTPTRRKDLVRPIVAGMSVASGIAAAVWPFVGLVAVAGVAFGTWASVSTSDFWSDDLSAEPAVRSEAKPGGLSEAVELPAAPSGPESAQSPGPETPC